MSQDENTKKALDYGQGNFTDEDGDLYLVRCPECKKENYMPAIAAGHCAWCGWPEKRNEK